MTEHGINTHSLETQIQDSNRYLPLLGRVLIGAPFVMSGLGKLAAYHGATPRSAATACGAAAVERTR